MLNKKWRYFVRLLFLCYFFIYAASPLSHSLPAQGHREADRLDRSDTSSVNPQIFIWEIIFSKIAVQETDQPKNGGSARVLLRKSRAVLSESTGFRNNYHRISGFDGYLTDYYDPVSTGLYIADTCQYADQSISFSGSDLSPPDSPSLS